MKRYSDWLGFTVHNATGVSSRSLCDFDALVGDIVRRMVITRGTKLVLAFG